MARPLTIEPRPSGKTRTPWVVHIPSDARHRYDGQARRYFKREGEAATFCKGLRRQRSEHTALFNQLPDATKAKLLEAHQILEPHGVDVVEAARIVAAMREQAAKSILLKPLIVELVERKRADGRRPRYLKDLEGKLGKFAASFPDQLASDIHKEHIDKWLRSGTLGPRSRDTYRLYIGVMFSFAKKRGYIHANPVLEVEAVNARREHEVPILTPEQLQALLRHSPTRLRAYVVICAFAGVRPEECRRLRWDAIRQGAIYVGKGQTKTVGRRVPVVPALQAWLDFFGPQAGPVCSPLSTWRKDFRAATMAAGWGRGTWPQDALRHSAISYWLAVEPNRAAVALWSGNSEAVQRAHYDNPRSPEEAAAWYAVLPEILNPQLTGSTDEAKA